MIHTAKQLKDKVKNMSGGNSEVAQALIRTYFMEQVDIYEQEQPDGRFLKHIKFRFPVYFGDRETQELCWDNKSTCRNSRMFEKGKIVKAFETKMINWNFMGRFQ